MRVLLIEDQDLLGDAVSDYVSGSGHAVDWMTCISDGRAAFETVKYDLILLDLSLPDGNGTDFLRDLRKSGVMIPVIILTARDRIQDRIEGLNTGADDYLVKPFDLDELGARIAAVLRRMRSAPFKALKIGDLVIQTEVRQVKANGETVNLTAKEWVVLEELARRPGMTISKERIEEALYAFGSEIESNTVEVYISRLRKKLGSKFIMTHRGLGYQIGNEE